MKLSDRITIGYDFCFFFVLVLYLLPLKWVLAWLTAAGVHELGHFLTLRLCKVRVHSLALRMSGAKMETDGMDWWVEALSAIAGPLSALALLLFRKHLPCTAVCVYVQSLYNLLPLYPLDGGRVLRCLRERFLNRQKADS